MTQSERNRALYNAVKANHPGAIITKSYLREEQTLQNNKSQYDYFFDAGVKPKTSERKISQQDLFVANAIGLFLLREDKTKIGSGVLRTSVASEFVDIAGIFNDTDLEAIYNGFISASVGQTKIFDALDTFRFRKVNAEFTNPDSAGTVDLEPALELDGKQKNKVTVEVPSWSGIQFAGDPASTFEHKLVVVLYGFLITGAGTGLLRG